MILAACIIGLCLLLQPLTAALVQVTFNTIYNKQSPAPPPANVAVARTGPKPGGR